jgi:hypothetical protein
MPVEAAAPNGLIGDAPSRDLELPAFNAAFQALSIEVPANKRLSPREKVTLHNPDDGTRLGKPLQRNQS